MSESSFLNPQKVLAAAHVHEGHKVADFGAGSGFFTRAAARLVQSGGEVWAVDVHQDLLPRIKNLAAGEGLHNVEVVRGDIEREGGSKLPPAAFDVVIASNIFFSATNKAGIVQEIKRVLKRSGRAIVVDWTGSFGGLGPHPDHVVSERSVRALFEAEGFANFEELPAGQYHWGFVVRKKSPAAAQLH